MSTEQHVEPSDVAVHEFVQLLAGWVPDEELAAVRGWLGGGESAAAAAAAVTMVAEYDVPLLAEGVDAAKSLADESAALDDVRPVTRYPRLPFWFSTLAPDGTLEADDLDSVIAEAAQVRSAQIAGVWRTWRVPLDGAADVDPSGDPAADGDLRTSAAIDPHDPDRAHRVYVVQVPDSAGAAGIAEELQEALAEYGDAGVEVIALDTEPPPYQAAALAGSALVWAARDEGPPFKVARVFDFAKPETGPGFHPEHRVVTDSDERDRMLRYLTSGTVVLHTTARTQDVLNPDAGQVVPTSFRTDGQWIWTDTVAYYLEQHSLAPDEELAAHIDARWEAGDIDPETDHGTAVEAAEFLLYPPPQYARKPAWTPGPNG